MGLTGQNWISLIVVWLEAMAFHYFFLEVIDRRLTHIGDFVEFKKIIGTQRSLLIG